jgi:ABC-type transport system involved in multi-copper enzyme maturation permease subunit
MIAAFASEWIKLRRRGMAAALAAVVGLSGLITLLGITHAGGDGRRSFITLAQLGSASGFAWIVRHTGGLLSVVALGVFASVFASEFSQGTMRNLLVRQPRRLRLLAGKYLATVTATAGALLAALAVCIPVGILAAGSKNVPTSAWWTGSGLSALAHTEVNLFLACVGYGTIGVLLGMVLRSPVAAIGAGLAYLLPVEGIVSAVISGASRWLPGQLLDAVAQGGSPDVTYRAAALTLLVYGLIAAAITGAVFTRRDVAS